MRCLMCQKLKDSGSIRDIFDSSDPLCAQCRSQWQKKRIRFRYEGIPLESSYVYNDAFSKCLIQYKELNDEALKDVFLYEEKERLHHKYHGYTLCLLPSSEEKRKKRGFSHLEKMFGCLDLNMLEPFEKTTVQSQKKATVGQRLEMRHHIRLKEGIQLPEKIVLCDDTITTGATLSGALSCLDLKAQKVRIYTVSANHRWL